MHSYAVLDIIMKYTLAHQILKIYQQLHETIHVQKLQGVMLNIMGKFTTEIGKSSMRE